MKSTAVDNRGRTTTSTSSVLDHEHQVEAAPRSSSSRSQDQDREMERTFGGSHPGRNKTGHNKNEDQQDDVTLRMKNVLKSENKKNKESSKKMNRRRPTSTRQGQNLRRERKL